MNDDSRAVAENFDYAVSGYSTPESTLAAVKPAPEIPEYLQDTYWWAYLHPKSFYFFEREWVVNLILWGNMNRLTQAVLQEMSPAPNSRVLQVACVYGDFSNKVASHLNETGSRLEIVDVAPIQIENVKKKLSKNQNVGAFLQDSTSMDFPAASFDDTVVFFLLHEQPAEARRKTVEEAIRVTRPGGKVIFVDYHGPKRSNPMRYVMKPILTWLEPFAMDLWRDELPAFMPETVKPEQIDSEFYFGGLYQKIVLTV
jgi:ubiquinone/menaquinone biosynthesis C-methylase UbiE